MGLDINFFKMRVGDKKKLQRYGKLNERIDKILCKANPSKKEYERDCERLKKMREEREGLDVCVPLAYFRKVNFLLPFFGYTDNCTDLEITVEQVCELCDRCKKVLDLYDAGQGGFLIAAEQLLPTTSGFFFGNTEYDEDYVRSVRDVREKMLTILKGINIETEKLYMHCWW